MKKIKLTAGLFRLLMSIALLTTISLIVAFVWFGSDQLRQFATAVSQTTSDANASQNNLQTLQKIKQELASQKTIIEKASSIVADSKGYKYQDQIIKDLNGYAVASGITITNFLFTTAAVTPAAPATSNSAGTTTPGASATPTAPSGVKATSASITLKSPVNYVNLLQFIHAIEQNLTKMQISRISLSKGSGHDDVNTDALEIQVYIN